MTLVITATGSFTGDISAYHPADPGQRLQQEGIDIAIWMGQGNWEGSESHYLFSDELIVVAAPGYNDGVLPATPSDIAKSDLIFSMESWKTWCMNAGLEKEIVPGGER